ncbi:hypothetical protein G7046_g1753 [Stylonectria norvegica]|nr:hypothetical protein G7046_g1753 [Stylonectria norvegica]
MAAQLESRDLERRDCQGHTWGFIAANVNDPPQCISDCRERFLRNLLPKDETFERVCEVLADKGRIDREQPFRALYCCDSQLCGVDNLGDRGKDPNVNWFINACQNIGYHSIVDPGPPDASYACTYDSIYDDDPRCQKEKLVVETEPAPSPGAPSSTSGAFVIEGLTTSPTTHVRSTSTPLGAMPTHTDSKISDPSLAASLDNPDANSNGNGDDSEGLSTGVKVTIAVCILVGLLAFSTLIMCLLRRRSHKHNGDGFRRHIKHHTSPPPAGSPTPLFSPTLSHTDQDGVPLTPPARLRERRLLPTVVNQRMSQGARPQTRAGFPASPLFAPTATKLIPRHERTPRAYGGGHSPPPSRGATSRSAAGRERKCEGSMRSFTSDPNTAASLASIFGASVNHSDTSSTRHLRPHETALGIPGLISPGPPPTRALPSTPPNDPISPTVSSPTRPRRAEIGIAIGTIPRTPAQDSLGLAQESRELCDLTEECARESRNSWGSWGGSGGGGPGVTVPSAKGRDGVKSPVMGEADLERLAGRY